LSRWNHSLNILPAGLSSKENFYKNDKNMIFIDFIDYDYFWLLFHQKRGNLWAPMVIQELGQ